MSIIQWITSGRRAIAATFIAVLAFSSLPASAVDVVHPLKKWSLR